MVSVGVKSFLVSSEYWFIFCSLMEIKIFIEFSLEKKSKKWGYHSEISNGCVGVMWILIIVHCCKFVSNNRMVFEEFN